MPSYYYKAVGADGHYNSGLIDATSPIDAGRLLKAKGLYLVGLDDIGHDTRRHRHGTGLGRFGLVDSLNFFSSRVKAADFVSAIQQMATLLDAGLPLEGALTAMIGQGGSELSRVFAQVRERMRGGMSFAKALEEHPRVFSSMFVSMIRAGESSGTLAVVVGRLAEHSQKQLRMRRRIQGALAYPLLMLIVGVGVIIFLMAFVIPKVTQIFFDLGHALPLPTAVLICVSGFVQDWWPLMGVMSLAGYIALWTYSRTQAGRRRMDRILLTMPFVGRTYRRVAVGRFCQMLGTLMKNGVPLVQSLAIVKSCTGNVVLESTIGDIREQVLEGRDMAGPMEESGIFLGTDVQMVAAGEQSGRLVDMLLAVARSSEGEVEARLTLLTSLMEPVMILLMGGVVGFIVMSIILPIFEMSHLVG